MLTFPNSKVVEWVIFSLPNSSKNMLLFSDQCGSFQKAQRTLFTSQQIFIKMVRRFLDFKPSKLLPSLRLI